LGDVHIPELLGTPATLSILSKVEVLISLGRNHHLAHGTLNLEDVGIPDRLQLGMENCLDLSILVASTLEALNLLWVEGHPVVGTTQPL
jgi:hypothetical protein